MGFDRQLEHLYARVTLVNGLGDPAQGRLCIMSFVALLAGEGHTDHPATASPVIRDFAVPVNDAMPSTTLQRMKPFAPRILGTNDGLDNERIELLRRALAQEILPRIRAEAAQTASPGGLGLFERLWAPTGAHHLEGEAVRLLRALDEDLRPHRGSHAGAAVARLLVLCARAARAPERQAWYWDEAIHLLDQLCDVGMGQRVTRIAPSSLRRAEALLPPARGEQPEATGLAGRMLALHWLNALPRKASKADNKTTAEAKDA